MKKVLFLFGLLGMNAVHALPSPDFQESGTANLSFSSEKCFSATAGGFNHDILKSEVGVNFDITKNMTGINAKIGINEGLGNSFSPAFSIGISECGLRTKHSALQHENIIHAMISKSFRKQINGRPFLGVFHGNRIMSPLSKGRKGIIIGYTQYLWPYVIEQKRIYDRLVIDVIYVTGKSSLAGCSIIPRLYFCKNISLSLGPTWYFNNKTVEHKKWSFEKVKWNASISIDI